MDYIINRLKEASTWQGIIVFVTGALHFVLPPEQQAALITIATGLIGAIWVTKKDPKSPDAVVNPTAVTNGRNEQAAGKIA